MKKDEKQKGGKAAIIADVMAKGVSARKASKAVNAVFDIWKRELGFWDSVETPCGTLEVKVTKGKAKQKVQAFRNIETRKPFYRLVRYPGRRHVIKLRPDSQLVVALNSPLPSPILPPPPQLETDEQIQERKLATELLRLSTPAADDIMATLSNAVGAHPRIPGERLRFEPGALLRRLSQFKDRGWKFHSPEELAQRISEFHWV